MTRFVPDTNCMIATVCAWHEHHEQAAEEIEKRLERGEMLFVVAHTLVEAYSVLTRLPSPYRLSPADAFTLIEENLSSLQALLPLKLDRTVRFCVVHVMRPFMGGGPMTRSLQPAHSGLAPLSC